MTAHPLQLYMRELSEELFCAGWLNDLEYILWEALVNDDFEEKDEYYRTPNREQLYNLRSLVIAFGVWFYWPEGEASEKPISLDRWRELVRAKRDEK